MGLLSSTTPHAHICPQKTPPTLTFSLVPLRCGPAAPHPGSRGARAVGPAPRRPRPQEAPPYINRGPSLPQTGPAPPWYRGPSRFVPSQSVPSHWLEALISLSTPVVEPLVPSRPRSDRFSLMTLGPPWSPHSSCFRLAEGKGAWTRTQGTAPNAYLHSSLATVLSLSRPTSSLSRQSSPLPISAPASSGPLVTALY